jgi:hypothetical protein
MPPRRKMFDDLNANTLPDEPGTLVAVYPDHPEATNPGRVFASAKVVTITVRAGGSAKGYMVADVGDAGDYTPASFAAEVVAAHSRGNDVFSGYWNDATDPAVRAALTAAGVTDFDFSTRRWRADWTDVEPTSLLDCVAWQWADGTMLDLPYDESAVAAVWPAVDTPWLPPSPPPTPPAPGPQRGQRYAVLPASIPIYATAAAAAAESPVAGHIHGGEWWVFNVAEGMIALTSDVTLEMATGWINPAQNVGPSPAPPAPPPAGTYTVTHSMPGYPTSEDAAAKRGSNSTVAPGTYKVFNRNLGMIALLQHDGALGWWINPSQ